VRPRCSSTLWRLLTATALGLLATVGSLGMESVAPHPVWAGAGDDARLEHELHAAKDFRVRLQAALELGRRKVLGARPALERALGDDSSAVRAAAAAALKSIGDPRALPALRAAESDSSEAVRNQVAAAIRALGSDRAVNYVVDLGQIDMDTTVSGKAAGRTLQRVARQHLRRLPGVQVKADAVQSAPTAPELLLDARISRLNERRSGPTLEVSAKVDFVLSRMPGREIKGRLSGKATVQGDAHAKNRARELEQLQLQAVEAAADSALDNVERALRAAVE
jgi:hypothetical protein